MYVRVYVRVCVLRGCVTVFGCAREWACVTMRVCSALCVHGGPHRYEWFMNDTALLVTVGAMALFLVCVALKLRARPQPPPAPAVAVPAPVAGDVAVTTARPAAVSNAADSEGTATTHASSPTRAAIASSGAGTTDIGAAAAAQPPTASAAANGQAAAAVTSAQVAAEGADRREHTAQPADERSEGS